MRLSKHIGERGQIAPVALFGVLIASAVLVVMYNTGQKVTERSQVANAADAAAYSGAVWVARHLNFMLETEIYRSQRYGYEFSLIFIDLDHFKQINDTHGHLVGSRLLGEIGKMIKDHCRLIDFAFRYGGDEFVVLLPQTSKEHAYVVARRLHRLIRETTWLKVQNMEIRITASVGVSSYPADSTSKSELLHLADEAMYLVKNTSRDSVAAANVGLLPAPAPAPAKK